MGQNKILTIVNFFCQSYGLGLRSQSWFHHGGGPFCVFVWKFLISRWQINPWGKRNFWLLSTYYLSPMDWASEAKVVQKTYIAFLNNVRFFMNFVEIHRFSLYFVMRQLLGGNIVQKWSETFAEILYEICSHIYWPFVSSNKGTVTRTFHNTIKLI